MPRMSGEDPFPAALAAALAGLQTSLSRTNQPVRTFAEHLRACRQSRPRSPVRGDAVAPGLEKWAGPAGYCR
jgi:hypothetical protein